MVWAAECTMVYLAKQAPKKGRRIRPDRLCRKIGVTKNATMDGRLKSLEGSPDCPPGARYKLVKAWQLGPQSMACELVCKLLLKRRGEEGFEHVKASVDECLAAMEEAIALVESGEVLNMWPKSKIPKCVITAVTTLNKHFPGERSKALIAAGIKKTEVGRKKP